MTLGAPVSEVFVDRHAAMLPPCWALCVGQAVRVEIGLVARAPEGWRRLGLEWAWRCRQEPRRLGLRYARAAVWYPVAVMRDLLSGRLA
jgi:N-acetylglucosaminyldiphosphoundecaprenol N-acetyl-beta-D-mannosaminyltransferase